MTFVAYAHVRARISLHTNGLRVLPEIFIQLDVHCTYYNCSLTGMFVIFIFSIPYVCTLPDQGCVIDKNYVDYAN